jgi:hypothetical protein
VSKRQVRTASNDRDRKLSAIKTAAQHRFPAADVDEMNAEIEQGYTRERQQIFENVTLDEIRDALNSPGTSNTRKD